jgi:hypothetical protein
VKLKRPTLLIFMNSWDCDTATQQLTKNIIAGSNNNRWADEEEWKRKANSVGIFAVYICNYIFCFQTNMVAKLWSSAFKYVPKDVMLRMDFEMLILFIHTIWFPGLQANIVLLYNLALTKIHRISPY